MEGGPECNHTTQKQLTSLSMRKEIKWRLWLFQIEFTDSWDEGARDVCKQVESYGP